MIHFFRRIRQQLLNENKRSKYLKYAIGEVILVMIGILLALQVNSWNQGRINKIEEQKILFNLHEEFSKNKALITETLIILKNVQKANTEIINLMGSDAHELSKYNLDSLFFESFPASQFTYSNQSVTNIIQGGRMNIIQNKEIIDLLYQWEAQTNVVKMREHATDEWTLDIIIPFLSKYISLKEMDSYGNYEWTGKSKLKPDYYPLFQSLEFENFIDNSLFLHLKQFEEIQNANTIAINIVNITKPNSK